MAPALANQCKLAGGTWRRTGIKAENMMALKLEDTLKSAGIETRTLTRIEWPGFPSGYLSLQADGAKAIDLWERLRSLTDHTGFWPLVVGEEEHLMALKENCEMELSAALEGSKGTAVSRHSVHDLINNGETLDLKAWLAGRGADDPKCENVEEGTWPVDLPRLAGRTLALTHRYDLTAQVERPLSRVLFLLLPLTVSWHVPAYLRLGGWNQCPQTETHIAIAKSWYQKYGAELIAATNNIVEMRINSPPKTKDESMKVAREQFIYCGDLIFRKYGTLSSLAAHLLDAPIWSFWWT